MDIYLFLSYIFVLKCTNVFFFVTLYIPFGFFFLYGFLYTHFQNKRVLFGSGLAGGLLLLMGSGSNIYLFKEFLFFWFFFFLFRLFYRKLFLTYSQRSLFMQTRVISFDLIPPQTLLRILFWLYSCRHFKRKLYILVDWRMNLLIEDLAI